MKTTLRLASVFSDSMVLCRDHNIRIFGEAHSGRTVTVTFYHHTACTTAVKDKFEVVLPPMAFGGPYTLTVTDGETELIFRDVLVGDVYLAGGQSNMEFALINSQDGKRYTEEADYPSIRYCNFPVQGYLDAETIEKEHETAWKSIAPGTCGDISAVAFHFAIGLHAELAVPIGIIGCYLGGTSITTWLDEQALCTVTGGKAYLDDYLERNNSKTDLAYEAEYAANQAEYKEWFRRADEIKAVNPSAVWADFTAQLGPCPWPPPEGRKAVYRPCGLVNTMVKRIAPYALTGILFYQGESDYQRPKLYRALLMALIASWRDLFLDASLPFLNVQLPMYPQRDDTQGDSWAIIRQAQEKVFQDMRNTGLAVLIDTGDVEELHLPDKRTVGDRLCLQALRVVYHRDADSDSPRVTAVRSDGCAMLLTVSAPLQDEKAPRLFELAGEDGIFYTADAGITDTGIRVTSTEVPQPRFVRYAWMNYGEANVFGKNGLPLAPFNLR